MKMMSEYTLGANTLKNLSTILDSNRTESVVLFNAVRDFINYTPIDFCIIENGGYRSEELQAYLFNRGVSKCDGVTRKSKHQSGLAVDLVPWVNGRAVWTDKDGERKHAFYLAGAFLAYCAMKGYDISSGADWNKDGNLSDGWDPCHMEIKEFTNGMV